MQARNPEETQVANGSDEYGATVAKRRLSARLAAMRKGAGLKPNQVDDMLEWKRGRLGRIERGDWASANPSYVRDLLRVYDPPADDQAEVMDLVRRASARCWWRKYAQPADPERIFDGSEFPGFENDASRISVYAATAIPDLLASGSYTDALMASLPARSDRWRARLKETRLRRQQILDRADGTAPRLVAVIAEASLLYRWGTLEQRRAQVRHLAEVSRRPNVELRLLRLADGLHPGMMSTITVCDFPDDQDPSIVFTGTGISPGAPERPSPGDAHDAETFARLKRASLAPSLTTEHLNALAGTLQ